MPAEGESALWVSVKVKGTGEDMKPISTGLSHYVLIDCSRSMKGEKIEAAKEALRQYVNILCLTSSHLLSNFLKLRIQNFSELPVLSGGGHPLPEEPDRPSIRHAVR